MNRKRLEQILDVSLTMFREKGFDDTSVMDICNACGITKPTFYKYVNSKEELLRHYYDGALETLIQAMDEHEPSNDYVALIWIGLSMTASRSIDLGPDLLSKYMILNFHEHTVTARYSAGGKQRTVEAIRKAQEAGQIRNLCDPEKLFMALKNLSLGLTLKWIMTKGSFPFFSHYGRMVEDIILPDYDAVLKQTGVDHRKKPDETACLFYVSPATGGEQQGRGLLPARLDTGKTGHQASHRWSRHRRESAAGLAAFAGSCPVYRQ